MIAPTCPHCGKPVDQGRHIKIGTGGGQDESGSSYVETRWRCDEGVDAVGVAKITWRENLEGRRLLRLVESGDLVALKLLAAWVAKNESRGNPLDADGAETIAICVGYGFHAHLLGAAGKA